LIILYGHGLAWYTVSLWCWRSWIQIPSPLSKINHWNM